MIFLINLGIFLIIIKKQNQEVFETLLIGRGTHQKLEETNFWWSYHETEFREFLYKNQVFPEAAASIQFRIIFDENLS